MTVSRDAMGKGRVPREKCQSLLARGPGGCNSDPGGKSEEERMTMTWANDKQKVSLSRRIKKVPALTLLALQSRQLGARVPA